MTAAASAQALAAFDHDLRADIPMVQAMGVSIVAAHEQEVTLAAPLAPNVNDKGCAFGGSLASLMTLAGWGLVRIAAAERGIACDIYVRETRVGYLAPVWGDFIAVARGADGTIDWEPFFAQLLERGKSGVAVRVVVPDQHGRPAADLDGRYVAVSRC